MRADHPDDQILNSLYAKEHPVRHRTVVSSNQRSRTRPSLPSTLTNLSPHSFEAARDAGGAARYNQVIVGGP